MEEKRMPTAEELTDILSHFGLSQAKIEQFMAAEDGSPYSVWHVQAGPEDYVLKRAKGQEEEVYRSFFSEKKPYAPALFGSVAHDGETYLLLEYCPGRDLRRCDRERLILTIDALGAMQDEFWEREDLYGASCTLEKSIKAIEDRGHWLGSERLETVYEKFIRVYRQTPRSLCHDDLLPFNVLVDERAVLIDWEYGGVLPYPGPLARLIAHGREDENAFFYMTRADREFANGSCSATATISAETSAMRILSGRRRLLRTSCSDHRTKNGYTETIGIAVFRSYSVSSIVPVCFRLRWKEKASSSRCGVCAPCVAAQAASK